MLTRWVNVSDGQQRVRFKYLKQKDVDRILKPLRQDKQRLDAKGDDATEEEKYLRFKLGNRLNLKPESVTNLIENKAILRGLYAAFKRARHAVEAATTQMESARFSGLVSKTASDKLVSQVMKTYFRSDAQTHRDRIVDILRKTRAGLSGPITISDCVGLEVGPFGGLAEGIVPFKASAMVAMERDGKTLQRRYQDSIKGQSTKKIKQAYSERCEAETMLMHQYLESGETGSIHIEFSYCLSKSVDAMARVIAHEATHKFGATVDFGYADKDTIAPLSPEKAALNADSYAYAAMSFQRLQLVGPADLDGEPAAISQKDADLGQLDVAWRKQSGW